MDSIKSATNTSSTAPENIARTEYHHPDEYALLRLILVDSLSPGRIVELPVDGGAVLTGRNGRGKTSVLQLLLLFYGESPSRIVTAEAGRDTFVGYYLPRTTSYIAFEYQRPGGYKRMVIAYADKAGERVLYRFVRHGFAVDQFIQADGEFVPAINLAKHLRLKEFAFSERQIESQTEYRHIIQGVPSNTTDKQHLRYLRELTQEYAFTSAKQPLRQIEKIVSGMFRRKTNFDDLQSMVIDCVADEVASHSISGDRRKIEDWPKGYKAYTAVMALAPDMAAIEDADIKLQAIELALGEIRAKYCSLADHLDHQDRQLTTEQHRLGALLEEEKNQFQQQRNTITDQQIAARINAEFAEGKAKELKDQYDAYEKDGIKELDARAGNAQQLRGESLSLEERRKALLGAQSEISTIYDRLKQTEQDGFNTFRDVAQQNLRQVADVCELDLRQMESIFEQSEQHTKQAALAQRHQLEQAAQLASGEHGRCTVAMEHPAADPKLLALHESKQQALEAARQAREAIEAQRRTLEASYRKALQDFQDQERQVSAAVRLTDAAEKELADKQRQFAPQEGSLLHFLRNELPHWSSDIAKVIRGDVLERTDLAPALIEPDNGLHGLYGLTLNLERLDAHPAADMHVAEQEVELAETRLKEARSALDKARAILTQSGAARELAEQAGLLHEQQIQKAKAQSQSALAEVEEARKQVEASKREAANVAQQRLASAQEILKEANEQLQRFDELSQAEAASHRATHTQKRRERQQKRDTETKLIDAGKAEREAAFRMKLEQYDAERDAVLRQKGVDTAKLKEIDDVISRITTELACIDSFIQRVQEWHYWTDKQWPACESFLADGIKARETEQLHVKTIAGLDAKWEQHQQLLQKQIKQLGIRLAQLSEQRKLARQHIDNMPGYPDVSVPEYDPSWTLDALSGLANQHTQDVIRLNGTIRHGIGAVASGFRIHQGTPSEQYLQTALGSLSPAPSREWIAPFKAWFAKDHQETQRILLMEAANIAGEVQAFHHTMQEFHRRVHQFNRELQEHLDTSLAFESISKVGVEIVSTITELQYWPAICEMAEAHRAWQGGASNDLPPPEFAQNIEKLLEHWEVKAGIRADLKGLIRIQGEVTENGNRRVFKRASDLEAVSSNGLSYLVLATIFVAFINRIRRDAKVNIVWALDELKDLDAGNVVGLVDLLERNNITLVSAFPDPDPDTLALFRHRFTVEPDRRLAEVRVALDDTGDETADTELEASHV
ncbi:MAG: ATP-binding protein [Burkholderiaceae bacterium]